MSGPATPPDTRALEALAEEMRDEVRRLDHANNALGREGSAKLRQRRSDLAAQADLVERAIAKLKA